MDSVTNDGLIQLFPAYRQQSVTDEHLDRVRAAIDLMKSYDPVDTEFLLAELMIQHVAYLVDEHNEFEDNWNITAHRRKLYSEHISWMKDSSIEAWTKRLSEYAFWRFSNPVICNLVANWLNGSLDNPRSFLA